jgi:hypothetical protein
VNPSTGHNPSHTPLLVEERRDLQLPTKIDLEYPIMIPDLIQGEIGPPQPPTHRSEAGDVDPTTSTTDAPPSDKTGGLSKIPDPITRKKEALDFTDALGRKFRFPWVRVQTWSVSEPIISCPNPFKQLISR